MTALFYMYKEMEPAQEIKRSSVSDDNIYLLSQLTSIEFANTKS